MDIEGAPGANKGVASAVYGVNRWDAAEFSSQAEKAKFLKIMVGPRELLSCVKLGVYVARWPSYHSQEC
jgi:hypothetical protein